jgi:NAD/NADP transhydrogenase alpha subunit
MYATNIVNLLKLMLREGTLTIDTRDEIIRDTLVAHGGRVVHERVVAMLAQEVAR